MFLSPILDLLLSIIAEEPITLDPVRYVFVGRFFIDKNQKHQRPNSTNLI